MASENARVEIRVVPDTKGFRRALQNFINGIEASMQVNLKIDADTRAAHEKLQDLHRFYDHLDVNVDLDRKSLTTAHRQLQQLKKQGNDLGKSLRKSLSGALRASVAAAGVSVLGGAMAVASVHAVSLASSLAPVAGLVAALPAVALGAAAAIGTLTLGLMGVGDALAAVAEGDAEKLQEALKKLAPSARAFVLEIKKFGPQFKAVQQAVQQRLFQGLAQHVGTVALAFRALQPSLVGVADGFNRAARSFATWLTMPETVNDIGAVIDQMALGLRALAPSATQFSAAMLDVAAVAAPLLRSAAEQASVLVTRFRDWVSATRESGQLEQILQGAITTLKTLGQIVANVGRALIAIGSAAGGGALTGLRDMTKAIADVLNSAAGQEGLASVFGAISAIARSLGPSLNAVAKGLAPLGAIVRDLAVSVGPGLEAVLLGLTEGLKNLSPSATPVGDALSTVASVIGDLLPLAGRLISAVLTPLSKILGEAALAAEPFISLLAESFVSAVETLMPFLTELAEFLLPYMAEGFRTLKEFLEPLAPLVIELAKQFGKGFVDGIKALKPILDDLIPQFKECAAVLGPVLSVVLKALVPLIRGAGAAFGFLVGGILLMMQPITIAIGLFSSTIRIVKQVASALKTQWNNAVTATQTAWRRIKESITGAIKGFVEAVTGVKDKVTGALKGAANWLYDAGKSIINGLIRGIEATIGALKKKLNQITSMIPDWKGPMPVDAKLLTPNGRAIIESLLPGFDQGAEKVRKYLQGLTGGLGSQDINVTGAALSMPSGFVLQIGGRQFDAVVVDSIERRREDVQRSVSGGANLNRIRG